MDVSNNPLASRIEQSSFKKPSIPSIRSNTKTLGVPTQSGSTTLRAGENRNKIALKPGFSALDWHELTVTKGIRGELITGLDKHFSNDKPDQDMISINHPSSIDKLMRGMPPHLIKPRLRINKKMLQMHDQEEDCWTVISGKVYCLTHYFNFHPGGVKILKQYCSGQDSTNAFFKYHRWISVDKMLQTCCVGEYINE